MPSRRALLIAAAVAGFGPFRRAVARAAEPPPPPGAPVWSAEYQAKKGAVTLAMFRKRVGEPRAGELPPPVLVFVHGSSISSRPSFDLTVPGRPERLFVVSLCIRPPTTRGRWITRATENRRAPTATPTSPAASRTSKRPPR